MAEPIETKRRLAAIFAADVEGYSRLMGADEVATLDALTARREILDSLIATHGGRIANTAGDSVLAEFGSAVDAVRCAMEAQGALATANSTLPETRRINFRIGVHVGDVMVRAGDLFGDGVNIAARLQTLARAGGLCISGVTFDQVRKILPLEFTDLGAQTVKNIEEPIRVYEVQAPRPTASLSTEVSSLDRKKPLAMPDKPSIAVLPFQNMSGDPEQEYFADGVVEDIITALSRFKSLFVIARNSSFTYKGKAVDIKQVGRELGVRYVLEGSVRKAASRVRLTGQLIEAESNNHLWADKFDGDLEDIFDLQDRITTGVVASILPSLEQAEIERARSKPTDHLDSYDLFLRGMALMYGRSLLEASSAFQAAFARDPEYAAAYAMAAATLMVHHNLQGAPLPSDVRADIVRWAQLAAQLGSNDAVALARGAQALSYAGREFDQAAAMIEQAAILNPNLSAVWLCGGFVALNCGNPTWALECFHRVLRLSPLDPLKQRVWYGIACAEHGLGNYEAGCAAAAKAIHAFRDVHSLGAFLVNAVAAGRLTEAREALDDALKLRPDFRLSAVAEMFLTRDVDWSNRVVSAFREAGLPE